MTNTMTHEWWGHLRHGGVLIAPQLLDEFFPQLPNVRERDYDRLRDGWLTFEAAPEDASARREFAEAVLRGFCGLIGWQKGNQVHDRFKATSPTGMKLRPDWVLTDASGERGLLAVSFDDAARLGIGRSKRAYARLVDLLRATGMPFGMLTNGRQFRLVHAGPDFAAWTEWDGSAWFDEAEGRDQLRGLRALVGHESLVEPDEGRGLRAGVQASRHRQGDLAQVLGEQVRRAVEHVIDALDAGLQTDADLLRQVHKDPDTGQDVGDDAVLAAIYQAATRVVMRLVVLLYAEARELLPRSNELYHGSYGVDGLYQQLTAATQHAGGLGALAERQTAWPRLLALFNVVHQGSPHQDLPIRDYGGTLFRSGDLEDRDTVLRALAVLEQNGPDDATVLRILRLLKIGKLKVRKGRSATWVSGPVDFSDLRTEYIGIIYEGLLDFQLKRAPDQDAIVFLNVGRQPALPLSRLEAMSDKQVKDLISELKKDKPATPTDGGEDDEANDEALHSLSDDEDEPRKDEALGDDEKVSDEALRQRARDWAEQAVEAAGTVRRTKKKSASEHARQRATAARKLIDRVVGPERLYLATWGGLRKGTGTFYTRPALAVPTTQRTLEPLCYDRTDEGLRPKTPEEILELKVCDPAMGSGSFPVAALRYLTDALTDSLIAHDRISAQTDGAVVTLPFGREALGDALEELLPVPLDDDRFETLLRSRLARHVVERCIYGVDINPMAVELARLALWVETMDRELPFEFLDHKLKVGNSLVGSWIHLALDYPAAAWKRQGGDGRSGEQTQWIKATYTNRVRPELKELLKRRGGEDQLPGFGDAAGTDPLDAAIDLREKLASIHALPTRAEREATYRELLLSEEYGTLKGLLDRWCAVWFWPADPHLREPALTPNEWASPSPAVNSRVEELAQEHRFFHWEVEFADAFRDGRMGFDAIVGNPPWEVEKPNSIEFFSRFDPIYRVYPIRTAERVQKDLIQNSPEICSEWLSYNSYYRAMRNVIDSWADPYSVSLGKNGNSLSTSWERARSERTVMAGRDHPYRLQGTSDLNTYKMFLELAVYLLRPEGRLGMIAPSGLWTDKGSTALRSTLLHHCSWEWCFGFENREKVFPIDSRYKFAAIVVQRDGRTEAILSAFMRTDISEWELRNPPDVLVLSLESIETFSPDTLSFLEAGSQAELEAISSAYSHGEELATVVDEAGGRAYRELHNKYDAHLFVEKSVLVNAGMINDGDDLRDPRVRAKLWVNGYAILFEGKSIWIHNPHFSEPELLARITDLDSRLADGAWRKHRLMYRSVGRSTDSRTMIPCVIPPGAHLGSARALDHVPDWAFLAGVLGSLASDFIIRKKVSANLTWAHVGTLPVPKVDSSNEIRREISRLALGLNDLGGEHEYDSRPLRDPASRCHARLMIDAYVGVLFGIDPLRFRDLASQFPVFDRSAGQNAYPLMAESVFSALIEGGPEVATARAAQVLERRLGTGHSLWFDEVFCPPGGWVQAIEEAREIVEVDV